MSLFFYAPKRALGTNELIQALGATRLSRFDGEDFWLKNQRFVPNDGDILVCWGTSFPEIEGLRVLNAHDLPLTPAFVNNRFLMVGVPTLTLWNNAAGPGKVGYMPRTLDSKGGSDFLNTVFAANHVSYWSYKEAFDHEYRIHSFNQKSIRAGIKVHRDGFVSANNNWKPDSNIAHPWVRTWETGWRIQDFTSTKEMRTLAHMAIRALDLTFGVVDIGELPNKTLKVLGVSTLPILSGSAVQSYYRAITKWIGGANGQLP